MNILCTVSLLTVLTGSHVIFTVDAQLEQLQKKWIDFQFVNPNVPGPGKYISGDKLTTTKIAEFKAQGYNLAHAQVNDKAILSPDEQAEKNRKQFEVPGLFGGIQARLKELSQEKKMVKAPGEQLKKMQPPEQPQERAGKEQEALVKVEQEQRIQEQQRQEAEKVQLAAQKRAQEEKHRIAAEEQKLKGEQERQRIAAQKKAEQQKLVQMQQPKPSAQELLAQQVLNERRDALAVQQKQEAQVVSAARTMINEGMTDDAKKYLESVKQKFNLPVATYEQVIAEADARKQEMAQKNNPEMGQKSPARTREKIMQKVRGLFGS